MKKCAKEGLQLKNIANQYDENMNILILEKKRVAKHQRDVINNERELSNKLRHAVAKLSIKNY